MRSSTSGRYLGPSASRVGRGGYRRRRPATPPVHPRWIALAALVVVVAAAAVQLARPVPKPVMHLRLASQVRIPAAGPTVPWPHTGQAALAVEGIGSIGSSGSSAPAPIASIAKVMTAYLTLIKHPLRAGQSGPTLTMTARDAAASRKGAAQSQSELVVTTGERLTERQVLNALLIASANDMADVLARFDAGSTAAFLTTMNRTAASLGMTHTHYTDPSGFLRSTVSTPTDQLRLAAAAMRNTTFRSIVASPQASFPHVGRVYNWNALVGHDGVVGIKTGSSAAAGGCLLFAAHARVDGHSRLVYGVVMGARGNGLLTPAFLETRRLLAAVPTMLHPATVLPAGATVATIDQQGHAPVPVRTEGPLTMLAAPGQAVTMTAHLGSTVAGATRGSVTAALGAQHVTVAAAPTGQLPTSTLLSRLTRLP